MKRILTVFILITAPFLFNGCSNNNDNSNEELFQKVQGKWKLTNIDNATGEDTTVENGYEMELKSDNTFTSNELAGYTGGTYTTINSPGDNIKLTFTNATGSILRYKYVNHPFDQSLLTQSLTETPLSEEFEFPDIQMLTRME